MFCGGIKDGATDPTAECNTYQIGHGWPQAGPTTPLPYTFYAGAHADLGSGRHWIGGGNSGSVHEKEHVLINGLARKILSPPLSQGLAHACAARLPDYKVSKPFPYPHWYFPSLSIRAESDQFWLWEGLRHKSNEEWALQKGA